MRIARYLGTASFTVALCLIGTISGAQAMSNAQNHSLSTKVTSVVSNEFSDSYYDIVSLGYYCQNGGTACYDNCVNKAAPCPGLDFAGVEAVGNDPGANYGVPAELVLQCGQTLSNGDVIESFLDTYHYGPNSEAPGSTPNGTIGAKGTLLTPNVDETATGSESSISGSSWSSDFTKVGSVTGIQYTDNTDHVLLNGRMTITIRGPIDNITEGSHHYNGTIACHTGLDMETLANHVGCPPTTDRSNDPFMAEGALETNAGDEFHNYDDLGPFDPAGPTYGFNNYLLDPGALASCGRT